MKIYDLRINNFRGIREGYIKFKDHTVLVGGNNSGKTTVIEAVTLLFGRDRLIRDLTEHDFFGTTPQPEDRIKIIATVIGFLDDDPDKNSEWFRDGRAVIKWLDEETGQLHNTKKEATDWRLACQIALQARFDHESLTSETIRYFYDHENMGDPFVEDAPVVVSGRLIQRMGYYLVRANRTWDKVFSWGSELFRRTIAVADAQPSEALLRERDRLRSPEPPLEQDQSLRALIERVNQELSNAFPTAKTHLRLTSTDSRSVMEAITAHFSLRNGPVIPAGRHGSGLVSMQGLLLLLELGRLRAAQQENFIMALEEPELHLSPSNQQQLVQRVQALSTQTIVTTHSPLVAAVADPTAVLILINNDGFLTAQPFLDKPLRSDAKSTQRRFYYQHRVDVLQALMQPYLLIPEGVSEFYILKILFNALHLDIGWGEGEQLFFGVEVGVIPTGDAQVKQTYLEMFRLHKHISCVVDGDKAGRQYARELQKLSDRPKNIISWPKDEELENIIVWILKADENYLEILNNEFEGEDLLNDEGVLLWLDGKKTDLIAYEKIANVITSIPACKSRVQSFFSSLNSSIKGQESELFNLNDDGVWIFQP